jgi:hypothetical protein
MLFNIILCGIVILLLAVLLTRNKEGFVDSSTSFPDSHTQFVKERTTLIDPATNQINLTYPPFLINSDNANAMKQVVTGLDATPTSTNYDLTQNDLHKIPSKLPDIFNKASKICEPVNTAVCSAFDDSNFAKNCGISFDPKGTGYGGTLHMGGLYVSREDYSTQKSMAANEREQHHNPYHIYHPTLGTTTPGLFSIDKPSCEVLKETLDCQARQIYGSPNCTQCFTTNTFSRIDLGDLDPLPCTLYLFGNGKASISGFRKGKATSASSTIALASTALNPTTPVAVSIPGDAEGSTFTFSVDFSGISAVSQRYIAGFIVGSTQIGDFKVDLYTISGFKSTKPTLSGATLCTAPSSIDPTQTTQYQPFTLIPSKGSTSITMTCIIPFTFINIMNDDALGCSNGPFITQAESATFLESDPCFGKENYPGHYKKECLQLRFLGLGGKTKGSGYPKDQATMDALQHDSSGNPLSIDQIVNNISQRMQRALSGNDAAGNALTVPDWNIDSLWGTGLKIDNVCTAFMEANSNGQPVSKACQAFLYENRGVNTAIGGTYTLGGNYATLAGTECFDNPPPQANMPPPTTNASSSNPQYNRKDTTLDPNTQVGYAATADMTSIADVQATYDSVNRLANDNTKTNETRKHAIEQAYGITIPPTTFNPADFDQSILPNAAGMTHGGFEAYCKSQGKRLCNSYEICDMGSRTVISPALTNAFPADNWVAVGDSSNEWLTLNRNLKTDDGQYNRYCRTYSEVTGGKYPDWGKSADPQPFYRVAKCCSGPPTLNARYLYIQYNHYEYLNLAQIEIYSDENTKLTLSSSALSKSSGYWSGWYPVWYQSWWWWWSWWWYYWAYYAGDSYPVANAVDGVKTNFTHTSGNEVPWLRVDLGCNTKVYKVVITNRSDCCRERVLGTRMMALNDQGQAIFASDPFTTYNPNYSTPNTYTWFPPFPGVYNDFTDAAAPSIPYRSMGCWNDNPSSRAMAPLSITNAQGSTTIQKAYNAAQTVGAAFFGIQSNGTCWYGNDAGFKKYGANGLTSSAGNGGNNITDVYAIIKPPS